MNAEALHFIYENHLQFLKKKRDSQKTLKEKEEEGKNRISFPS